MSSVSMTTLFDRFMTAVGPVPEADPAPALPPPTLPEILALAAVPDAGGSAWFLLVDMLDHHHQPPDSLR